MPVPPMRTERLIDSLTDLNPCACRHRAAGPLRCSVIDSSDIVLWLLISESESKRNSTENETRL